MLEFLGIYNNIWSCVETVSLLVVVFIFFKDSLRRWNFFGYRPTAIMGLLDFKTGKVLMVAKQGDPWFAFSQGGIYNSDINWTAKEILKRELGLEPNLFSLRYTQPLGTIRLRDPKLLNRATLNSICITSKLRGKGYLACYIRCNLEGIEQKMVKGEGIGEIKIMSIDEATAFIKKQGQPQTKEHQKQKMILVMLDEMRRIVAHWKDATETEQKAPEKTESS